MKAKAKKRIKAKVTLSQIASSQKRLISAIRGLTDEVSILRKYILRAHPEAQYDPTFAKKGNRTVKVNMPPRYTDGHGNNITPLVDILTGEPK